MADQIVTSRLAAIRAADMVGDSRFLEFPSVVDALRCVIEVQRSMREHNAEVAEDKRIEFRIGINVGDVMPEGEDLLGDDVTLAARIRGLAEPGGICLSGTARDQVRDRLALELAGLVLWLGQCASQEIVRITGLNLYLLQTLACHSVPQMCSWSPRRIGVDP